MKSILKLLVISLIILVVQSASSQSIYQLPYPVIFVHGLNSNDTTWNDVKNLFETNYGLKYGGRMDFCLNQDGNVATSKLSDDYKDYTNSDVSHQITNGDFYTINFDVDNFGVPYDNKIRSNQSAIVKQGKAVSDAIKHVLEITGKDKVILVGHSMGGLASREYLQNKHLWYEPNIYHHVAKLCTVGTPHGGSNASGGTIADDLGLWFKGLDYQSEAVRDLRTNYFYSYFYPIPALPKDAPGTYLFGGIENLEYMFDKDFSFFYNADVNCDGDVSGIVIVGLNSKSIPNDLEYSCIVGVNHILGGDGIVSTKSANINNFLNVNAELFYSNKTFHTNLTNQLSEIMQVLDEPNEPTFAYQISENSNTKGFFTIQSGGGELDLDVYKVVFSQGGSLAVNLLDFLSGSYAFELLNGEFERLVYENDLTKSIRYQVQAGTYYIRVAGLANNQSWRLPYDLKTQFAATPINSLNVSANSIEYFDALLNSTVTKSISLKNNGVANIEISNLELTGLSSDQYSINELLPLSISVGESRDISIDFTPKSVNLKEATLIIHNNTSDTPTISILLSGKGVENRTKTLFLNPSVIYNYGEVQINDFRSKIFSLQNTGTNTVTVSNIAIEGLNTSQFNVESLTPFELGSGETKKVIVTFTPKSAGTKSASIVFTNNSDNLSPKYSMSIFGKGTENYYSENNNALVDYEYWFDNEEDSKIVIPILNSDESAVNELISIEKNIDISKLKNGGHTLYLRVVNAKGIYSFIQRQSFWKDAVSVNQTPNLKRIEYFFDTDPGINKGNAISFTAGKSVDLAYTINLTEVSNGGHTLYVRSIDENGKSSFIQRQSFWKDAVSLNQTPYLKRIEYFFDTDPGINKGKAIPFSTGKTADVAYTIDLNSVTNGGHTLYVRSIDENGKSSFIQRQSFWKDTVSINQTPNLKRIEYFFDTDPGINKGNAIPFTAGKSVDLAYTINLTEVSNGGHTLYVRSIDENGKSSFIQRQSFWKTQGNNANPDIVEIDYFVDNEPDVRSLFISRQNQAPFIDMEFDVNLTGLTGKHLIYVRAKDSNGNWSFMQVQEVCAGVNVDFTTNKEIYQPDETIVLTINNNTLNTYTYQWDFNNNGNYVSTTDLTTTTQFALNGNYQINLKITDPTNSCNSIVSKSIIVSNTTEINNTYDLLQAVLYPNPTRGDVNIKLNKDVKNIRFEVFGIDGKLLITQKLDMFEMVFKANLSNLLEGVYIIKISDKSESIVKPLIIKK